MLRSLSLFEMRGASRDPATGYLVDSAFVFQWQLPKTNLNSGLATTKNEAS